MNRKEKRAHLRMAFVVGTFQVLISIGYIVLAVTAPTTARGEAIIGLYLVTLLVNGYVFRKCIRNGRTQSR